MGAGRGIRADLTEIAASGHAIAAAADRVDRIDLAPELPEVARALPDSQAALWVGALTNAWSHGFDRWADAARHQAQALTTGAGDFQATEAAVRRALGSRAPEPPTPGPWELRGVR